MTKIDIDNSPSQEFTIPFEGKLIFITLEFRLDYWLIDLTYKEKTLKGLKLSSNVLMLQGINLPFDIMIDGKNSCLDPYTTESFSDNSFDFLLVTREELQEVRKFEVE